MILYFYIINQAHCNDEYPPDVNSLNDQGHYLCGSSGTGQAGYPMRWIGSLLKEDKKNNY